MDNVIPLDASIVLPCYNAKGVIEESVRAIIRTLERTHYRWEIIFVDDASNDDTVARAEQLCAADARLRLIRHAHNTGRGRAVADGLRAARGTIAGYIDLDLEVPARYLPAAIAALHADADLVCAWRISLPSVRPRLRKVLSQGYAQLVREHLGLPIRDTEAGFKFFNRQRILPILDQTNATNWFWDTEIMTRAHFGGLRVVELPVIYVRRPEVPSTVRLLPDTLAYWRQLRGFRAEAARLRNACAYPAPEASRVLH